MPVWRDAMHHTAAVQRQPWPIEGVMRLIPLAIGCVVGTGLPVFGQPVEIKQGFYTGLQCSKFDDRDMQSYAAGLVDGVLLAPLFNAPKASLAPFEQCIVGKSDVQMGAVLKKRLREHPEEWHEPCHIIAYRAFLTVCPR